MSKLIELPPNGYSMDRSDREWLRKHTTVKHIAVFLPSTSRLRMQNVQRVVDGYGIPVTAKTVNGPAPEVGITTADKALHKAKFVADILHHDGHLDRKPQQLTLIFAMDSRNAYYQDGQPVKFRDKPDSLSTFAAHHAEWTRTELGEAELFDHSAYAMMVMFGGRQYATVVEDLVELHPTSRNAVDRAFLPLDKFELQCRFAHGFGAAQAIQQGTLAVTDLNGLYVSGMQAVDRVSGASERCIGSLLETAFAFVR